MKTTLPERSLVIQERLDNIVQEILATSKEKIAMIILFGSYARGDWVIDKYLRGHITYTYNSDLDLMVVLRNWRNNGYESIPLKHKIQKRLEDKSLTSSGLAGSTDPSVTLVLEPIAHFNSQLEKGRYFFTDIKKEGVLLYDNGEFTLAEARELPWKERIEIAEKDYRKWFKRGMGFLWACEHQLEIGCHELAAFQLHQATESFYNTILLVFSGYKPKLHDILELGKRARIYSQKLFGVFPYETPEQRKCFELLMRAYIDARYEDDYQITEEQLLYLIERVEELANITEKICFEWLVRHHAQAGREG